MFEYDASVERIKSNRFNVVFTAPNLESSGNDLPAQPIQRVYRNEGTPAVILHMILPLSAPLHDKESAGPDRTWTLLDEIIHCPDPFKYPLQHSMWRSFHDPRRQTLVTEYGDVLEDELLRRPEDRSWLMDTADIGLHIFDIGRPPRAWTVGGAGSCQAGFKSNASSVFGQTMYSYNEADLLVFTEEEHCLWAANNNGTHLKNVLIVDKGFNERRPRTTSHQWLEELSQLGSSNPQAVIDIQMLSELRSIDEERTDTAVRAKNLPDAIEIYRKFEPDIPISRTNAPTNFLNLNRHLEGMWPTGMVKHYTLLQALVARLDTMLASGNVGKPPVYERSPCDIRKCQQFMILGQRGAASPWHMDQNGVYTFVHLEANSDTGTEHADEVVKFWPSFPMEHLSEEDKKTAREEFSESGINWRPQPKGGVPVVIILKGQLFLQRPGNIHAPITLTESLFTGGMAWKVSSLRAHLEVTQFLSENIQCTNEDLPKQLQAILAHLRPIVHKAPELYGYPAGEPGMREFDEQFLAIYSGFGVSCDCTGACVRKCLCKDSLLKCSQRCHDKREGGENGRFGAIAVKTKAACPACSNVDVELVHAYDASRKQ